jgi:hypothetical protein
MLQLISIALFALAGFSSLVNAAPIHHGADLHETSAFLENMSSVGTMNSIPTTTNWKRHHHQESEDFELSNKFIDQAISRAMISEQKRNMVEIMKRQSDDETNTDDEVVPEFNLEDMFRGIFDKVVDHIIEVTPLSDIVHGNYDLLYDLSLSKLQELVSSIGANIEAGATTAAEGKA